MPYKGKVKEGPKGWVQARFQGVKETTNPNYVQARFITLETEELVTMPMEVPFRLRDVNQLFRASGVQPKESPDEIELPMFDEDDKMGMDEVVEVNIKEKNGYFNVEGIRETTSIGGKSEDDVPF